jgi:transposase
VSDIEELKRQGLSIRAISRLTGFDPETIRKYLLKPEGPTVRSATGAAGQARRVQAVPGRTIEGRRIERAGAAAGVARSRVRRRLRDPQGLGCIPSAPPRRRWRCGDSRLRRADIMVSPASW